MIESIFIFPFLVLLLIIFRSIMAVFILNFIKLNIYSRKGIYILLSIIINIFNILFIMFETIPLYLFFSFVSNSLFFSSYVLKNNDKKIVYNFDLFLSFIDNKGMKFMKYSMIFFTVYIIVWYLWFFFGSGNKIVMLRYLFENIFIIPLMIILLIELTDEYINEKIKE